MEIWKARIAGWAHMRFALFLLLGHLISYLHEYSAALVGSWLFCSASFISAS